MGAGIAQAAAQAGIPVVLYDVEQRFLDRARERVHESLDKLVGRGKMSAAEADQVKGRFSYVTTFEPFGDCQVVVEVVPESMDVKADVMRRLHDVLAPNAIIATNTSSLNVTEIARTSGRADRVGGMHFFNPPTILRLVEVVRGETTAESTSTAIAALARRMGKTPVLCKDTPGFIVNRVARPFYLEGLRLLGEGVGDVPTIDAAVREAGFAMGPFQLMDLIGIDVNFTVTRSVWEQRFMEPRLRPHPIQQALFRAGRLGRKTGQGFYDYTTDPPVPLVKPEGIPVGQPPLPHPRWERHLPARSAPFAARVISVIVNEAYYALGEGVASAEDIDVAMQLGTSYPKGPIEWAREIDLGLVFETLEYLENWFRDGRYAPAPLLRRHAEGPSSAGQP